MTSNARNQRHEYAAASLLARSVEPSRMTDCSHSSGWTVGLLRVYASDGECAPFETVQTPDQTLVVHLRGSSELKCLSGGLWRSGITRPGALGMTPAGETSRLRWRSLQDEAFVSAHLHMPGSLFEESMDEHRRAGRPTSMQELNALCSDEPGIARLVDELTSGLRSGAGDLFAEELLRNLADRLVRFGRERPVHDEARKTGALEEPRLRRALEFMSADLATDLSVGDIAREAGVSVYHFVRMFRQATGQPPHAYLTSLRLEAGRRMLERSDLPVGSIACLVGYPLPRNFSSAYARRYGSTPGEWRRRVRGSSPSASVPPTRNHRAGHVT